MQGIARPQLTDPPVEGAPHPWLEVSVLPPASQVLPGLTRRNRWGWSGLHAIGLGWV